MKINESGKCHYLCRMKKNVFIAGIILCVSAILAGCGRDCAREDCGNQPIPTFSFRIVNSANQDLLVGPAKLYDTANVKVSGKNKTNGNTENIKRFVFVVRNANNTADSLATVGFTVTDTYSVYYLSLNNTVTDSVYFGYAKKLTECCDFSNFYLSRFNNIDIPGGGEPLPIANGYIIRK
jgi:hypothetical protein